MGQTLSEPVTTKHTESCQNQFLKVGSSSMQGWRINMEDSHTHILALPDDPSAAFFGVYDGHGGARIAQYAGKHLHKFITKRPEYEENKISDALQLGFMDMDTAMAEDELLKDELAGSTAVVVLLKDKKMYCANVGDSRAIASVSGVVEPLSYDHKPNNELETKRIEAAGGWVMFNRVNGNLALSRALGDYIFKKNDQKKLDEQIVIGKSDLQNAINLGNVQEVKVYANSYILSTHIRVHGSVTKLFNKVPNNPYSTSSLVKKPRPAMLKLAKN